MWDTATESRSVGLHLSHDRLCQECGHALHTFLPCSDHCGCQPQWLPGSLRLDPAV
jgi:hypothetical protein